MQDVLAKQHPHHADGTPTRRANGIRTTNDGKAVYNMIG
jgi:hypothetical protein